MCEKFDVRREVDGRAVSITTLVVNYTAPALVSSSTGISVHYLDEIDQVDHFLICQSYQNRLVPCSLPTDTENSNRCPTENHDQQSDDQSHCQHIQGICIEDGPSAGIS